jgi:hypothetical protein
MRARTSREHPYTYVCFDNVLVSTDVSYMRICVICVVYALALSYFLAVLLQVYNELSNGDSSLTTVRTVAR